MFKEHYGLVRIQFLGTGTPLGLGGLHQACILLTTDDGSRLLVDCGMTALASLGRAGLSPTQIDAVVISHLHGDHFGGLAPLLLDAALQPRTAPLSIAGPPATRARVEALLSLLGWTSVSVDAASFVVLEPRQSVKIGAVEVTAIAVPHNPATQPTGIRLNSGSVSVGYSGDAGWSPALVDLARGTDLFICAVWSFDTPDPTFLDLKTLASHREQLECRRLILTHLGTRPKTPNQPRDRLPRSQAQTVTRSSADCDTGQK